MKNTKHNRKLKYVKNKLINSILNLTNTNRYRRSKLNAVPYCYKSKPQKYGPGKNLCIINNLTTIPASGDLRISLQDALLGNAEFSTKKMFYRYFKLLEVRMVFFPNGTQSNNFHFINLTWNDVQYTAQDLTKDDSSKIVSVYRSKMKVIRWKPIRGVINVNSVSQSIPTNFLDVSQFISTDRVVSFPGWLMISSAGNDDRVSLEIIIEFRGNDYGDVAKKFENYLKINKNSILRNNSGDYEFIREERIENKIDQKVDDDKNNNLNYDNRDDNSEKIIHESNHKNEVQFCGDIEDSNNLKLLSDHIKSNKENSKITHLTENNELGLFLKEVNKNHIENIIKTKENQINRNQRLNRFSTFENEFECNNVSMSKTGFIEEEPYDNPKQRSEKMFNQNNKLQVENSKNKYTSFKDKPD